MLYAIRLAIPRRHQGDTTIQILPGMPRLAKSNELEEGDSREKDTRIISSVEEDLQVSIYGVLNGELGSSALSPFTSSSINRITRSR